MLKCSRLLSNDDPDDEAATCSATWAEAATLSLSILALPRGELIGLGEGVTSACDTAGHSEGAAGACDSARHGEDAMEACDPVGLGKGATGDSVRRGESATGNSMALAPDNGDRGP